jgi:hypothetical protein
MSRVRFATARAVFETFPEAAGKIGVQPTDQQPLEFLRGLLAEEKLAEAVTFCAYMLPRREAVWWACRSVRALIDDLARRRIDCLKLAEAWVYEPDEERRRAALAAGTQAYDKDALTWLALGAGWAGGLLSSNPKRPIQMPHYMTPRAARLAVIFAGLRLGPEERDKRLRACIEDGIKLAQSDDS